VLPNKVLPWPTFIFCDAVFKQSIFIKHCNVNCDWAWLVLNRIHCHIFLLCDWRSVIIQNMCHYLMCVCVCVCVCVHRSLCSLSRHSVEEEFPHLYAAGCNLRDVCSDCTKFVADVISSSRRSLDFINNTPKRNKRTTSTYTQPHHSHVWVYQQMSESKPLHRLPQKYSAC